MASLRVAALGEQLRLEGFTLAGVLMYAAETPDEVRAAWERLPDDVGLVVLSTSAARALGPERTEAGWPLTVVAP